MKSVLKLGLDNKLIKKYFNKNWSIKFELFFFADQLAGQESK